MLSMVVVLCCCGTVWLRLWQLVSLNVVRLGESGVSEVRAFSVDVGCAEDCDRVLGCAACGHEDRRVDAWLLALQHLLGFRSFMKAAKIEGALYAARGGWSDRASPELVPKLLRPYFETMTDVEAVVAVFVLCRCVLLGHGGARLDGGVQMDGGERAAGDALGRPVSSVACEASRDAMAAVGA